MWSVATALSTALSTAALLVAGPAPAATAAEDALADVVARGSDGRLWLFPNDGSTPWAWTERRIVGSDWNHVDRMLLCDVTLDGHQDIVAREPALQSGTLWVHPNDGTELPWTTRFWAGYGWNIAIVVLCGDVTGDDRPDLVTREADGRLWLYPHNGATTSLPYDTRRVIGANWQFTTALLLGDVTGDGRLDLVARDPDGFLWIYPPPSTRALWSPQLADAPYPAGAGWEAYNTLLLADANGDGRPDVLARDASGTLWVFPHNGAPPGTNPWPQRHAAGDWWRQYTALLAG